MADNMDDCYDERVVRKLIDSAHEYSYKILLNGDVTDHDVIVRIDEVIARIIQRMMEDDR